MLKSRTRDVHRSKRNLVGGNLVVIRCDITCPLASARRARRVVAAVAAIPQPLCATATGARLQGCRQVGLRRTRVVDQLSVTPLSSWQLLLLLQPGQLDNRAVCCSFCQGLVETLQFHLWSVTENSGGGSECRGESLDTATSQPRLPKCWQTRYLIIAIGPSCQIWGVKAVRTC